MPWFVPGVEAVEEVVGGQEVEDQEAAGTDMDKQVEPREFPREDVQELGRGQNSPL
jgi:hypothetical protein